MEELKLIITSQKDFDTRPLLPKKVKQQWVEALKSGKYQQGREYLNKNCALCCLGVLCEVLNLEKTYISAGMFRYQDSCYTLGFQNPYFDILDTSGNFVGFVLIDSKGKNFNNLANLNDKGYSFQEIANIIEQYF